MKYHSSIPAIVISCVVLMLFATVSVGIVYFLSDSSPTLNIANDILTSLNEADSNVSVSFASIDRNLKSGLFVNDISIEGDNFSVSFERLSLRMGLISLLKYALTGGSNLTVDAEGSSVEIRIPERDGTSDKAPNSFDIKVPEIFSRYNIALHVHDLNVSVPELLSVKDGEIDIAISDKLIASGHTSFAGVDYNGIVVELEDISFDFIDQLRIFSGLSTITYNDSKTEIKDLRADLSLEGKLALSFSGLKGIYKSIHYESGQAGINYNSSQISVELTDLELDYQDFNVNLASTLVYLYNRDDFSVFISGLNGKTDDLVLLESEWLQFNGSIEDKSLNMFSPEIKTEGVRMLTDVISSADLKRTSFSVGFEDDIIIYSFTTGLCMSSELEKIDGVSADISMKGGTNYPDPFDVSYYTLSVSNGQFPAVSTPFDIEFYNDLNELGLYFSLGSSLLFSGNITKESLSINADLTDLRLGELSGIVEVFLPQFSNWVGETTSVTGMLGVDLSRQDWNLNGPLNMALAISDIKFNDFRFSLGTSFSAYIKDKLLTVSSASITTDPVRLVWSGTFDLERFLPSGQLSLSETSTGNDLFKASINLSDNDEYFFFAQILRFPDSYFSGNVDFKEDRVITSSAELKLANADYPVDVMIDLASQLITIDNENVEFYLDYSRGKIVGSLLVDSLPLPAKEESEQCMLEASVFSLFDFYTQRISLNSPYIRILNIGKTPYSADLAFKVNAANEYLRIEDIVLTSVNSDTLTGALEFDFPDNIYTLYLSSDNQEETERLIASVNKLEDYYSGILRLDNFNLTRFGLDSYIADMNLMGRGSQIADLAFSGKLNAWHLDGLRALNANVYIDISKIRLTEASFTGSNVSLDIPLISLDASTGMFALQTSATYVKENMDKDYPMKLSLSIDADLHAKGNLADVTNKYIDGDWRKLTGSLVLVDLDIDNNYKVLPVSSSFMFENDTLVLSGAFLDGVYSPVTGEYDLTVDVLPIARSRINGYLGGGQSLQLHAAVESLDISIVNLLLRKPYVHLYEGTMVHGDIHLINDGDEWELYGNAEAETAELDVFWLPGSKVVLHNPTFMAWDNLVISNVTNATVVNLSTYEKKPGKIDMALQLLPNLHFSYFEVNVAIEDGNEVDFRMPVIAANIDMWGKVSGTLSFHYQDQTSNITGDVTAQDGRFSIGVEPLPDWWVPSKKKTVFDFNVFLRENLRIVIPLSSDPILTAYATENQHLRIKRYDDLSIELTGNIGIRSGEFYYISKNFYITEGNVEFQNTPYSDSFFNPVINLRARLRDFDDNGNEVDIYVVLRDATLDNLSPFFESSPAKSTEEIMQILGLAMLPSSVYGDFDLSALAGLVSTSWDVLSHAGFFNFGNTKTFSFEDTIRDSLNLDAFSLHTKIVTNVIWDTVRTAVTENSYNLSPMARYLDGTSIYLGKYLTSSLYLEGLIHFTAIDNQFERRHTFIADDLNLDVELSVEWDMPIATIKYFTQPMNITFYSLMDSFGFSVTKRIVW